MVGWRMRARLLFVAVALAVGAVLLLAGAPVVRAGINQPASAMPSDARNASALNGSPNAEGSLRFGLAGR